MPPVPKYTRRWFQFSMGTMFVVVTLLAALGVWIANSFHWIQERREILALAMTLDDGTGLTVTGYSMTKRDGLPKAPFSLRILGESGCDKLQIAFPRKSREGGTFNGAAARACQDRATISRGDRNTLGISVVLTSSLLGHFSPAALFDMH